MVREREEQLAMCAEEHETREGLLCGEITHRDEHIGALRDEVQMLLGRVDELDHQNREMDAYQRGELEVSITPFRPPFFLCLHFTGVGPRSLPYSARICCMSTDGEEVADQRAGRDDRAQEGATAAEESR
jgi:hypothetical protein